MILGLDSYNNLETPPFILCKPNGERIGTIPYTSKKGKVKFNDYNEISFTTHLYIDGEKNDIYDKINELMFVEVPEFGMFVINNITINSEGTKYENKECTAFSEEVLLAQKYLELFTINGGTVESVEYEENVSDMVNVQFYNDGDPSKSLLNLVLGEKCPNWSVGHVDNELYEMQRSFQVDRQDIYSFLTQDVSKAFECIFIFDTINHKVNAYTENNIGEDTDIHISYANLAKNVNISCSTDDIKTCLTVTGKDDLGISEVNMGKDRIYNLDYFHSTEYMSQELYYTYGTWKELWNSKVNKYEELVTEYQDLYDEIYKLTVTNMPETPDDFNDYEKLKDIDWTPYGLNPLKEALAVLENQQAVMIKAGQGNEDHEDRETKYVPVCNAIDNVRNQIEYVNDRLKDLEKKQSDIDLEMKEIQDSVEIDNYFKTRNLYEELNELHKFIREDELSSENYVVTENDTSESRRDMLHKLLEYGQKELAKVAVPTMEFTMDMINIYAIPEFKEKVDKFDVGNYIYVTLRDDFSLKLRLLSIDINFLDKNDFSTTFGNVTKLKGSKLFEDITNALELATSTATTVSFNSSYWNKANVDSTAIGEMLTDGLLAAGQRIETTESDVVIDDRGIFISNNPSEDYKDDVIFIGGGQIVFSDDNLKTIKTALGRVQYTKQGRDIDDFGLIAQVVIAGYVGGSVIEGNTITNGNGTFFVDEEGNLTATSATIKGDITADTGHIGGEQGFTIKSGKLYSGTKLSFDNKENGVYIGTDGISLGKGNTFSVDKDGNLTATSGYIGGAKITANAIEATNGNWKLDNTGVATLKGATINGVAIGSTFGGLTYNNSGNTSLGGITYDTNGTYGNFSNGISANVSFGLEGGALTNFNNLVVKNITAENIKATNVLADYLTTNKLATTELNANNITSGTLSADRINVGSLRIGATQITGTTRIPVVSTASSKDIKYMDATGTVQDLHVVTGIDYKYLYVLGVD